MGRQLRDPHTHYNEMLDDGTTRLDGDTDAVFASQDRLAVVLCSIISQSTVNIAEAGPNRR